MSFFPACLGEYFLAHEQAELDAHAGKADALAAFLGARRDVVKARQLAPLIPLPCPRR